MSKFLYNAFALLYPLAVKAISPFNKKAKLWTNGRKNIFAKMREALSNNHKVIWFHCASLGEFEQGRPVIEKMRSAYPTYKILLTFFSPSGFEIRKDYDGADFVFYLPMDSKKNAELFFDIVKPQLAVFVKYEFWHYYLNEAKKRKIPLLLISSIFRKEQPFFSGNGNFHRQMLSCFTHLFVQNNDSVALLKSIGFTQNVSVAGDTRFDRVIEIAEKFEPIERIENLQIVAHTIVAGSTWPGDDKILSQYANTRTDVRFIVAPHNINTDRINDCLKYYKNAILYSVLTEEKLPTDVNTIIIDNVGMLSRLYKYGTVNYVGGGFAGDGVHNVLEAAVYGKPVVFGPIYEKYIEAIELVQSKGGVSIENTLQLQSILDKLLQEKEEYDYKSKASLDYVYSKRGSTQKILQFIQEKRLLTN